MPRRWRKALGLLLALLFAAVAIIIARLDAGRLAASALAHLPAWAAHATHGGQADFSLMQGLTLSLRDVRVQAADGRWQLHADRMRLSLSLWELLHGRADIRQVDIVHPVLRLSPQTPPPAVATDMLPKGWDRLRVRQGEVRAGQRRILWSLDATIRRIHARREITWDAQALADGGSLTLQGRIRRQQHNRRDIFGSLKIKGAHPATLPPAWRRGWPAALMREKLDASLTFDMDADGRWSLFGDARLRDAREAKTHRPELRWRGKVKGMALDHLAWRDAYLRVGKAAFATHGTCSSPAAFRPFSDCRFEFNARNADIRPLAALTDTDIDINGRLDMTARGAVRDGAWHMRGSGRLRGASWNAIPLPDARLALADAQWQTGNAHRWNLRNLRITPAGGSGALLLAHISAERASDTGRPSNRNPPVRDWRVEARLEQLHDAWVAWSNALLKQFGKPAALEGRGILNGKILIAAHDGWLHATCRLDATHARMAWGQSLIKPAGVRARLQAELERGKDAMQLRLARVELGPSHLADSEWRWRQDRLTDVSAADARIAPDELRARGVILPEALRDWHGTLTGALADVHPSETADLKPAWLAEASGRLMLTAFGTTQRISGLVELSRGRLRATGLRWREATRQPVSATAGQNLNTLEMDVDVRLASTRHRGHVDIHRATLDWNTGNTWPAWLANTTLHGQIRNVRLHWMDNNWKILRGRYRLHGGILEISRLRGRLAEGSMQSPKLTLRPAPAGVRFDGLIRLGAVRLGHVRGLGAALGGKLDGYLYLNARLHGALPWTAATWRGNGDVEIQRGRWQATDTRIHLAAGDTALETGKPQRFSRLTARFRFAARASSRARLVLSRLRMEMGAGGQHGILAGHAAFYAGGALSGNARIRKSGTTQHITLSGVWPQLGALLAPRSSEP